MNVRWIKWSELLQEAGIVRNVDTVLNQIEGPEARRIAQAVNIAVEYAWKYSAWECACWVMNENTANTTATLLEQGYAVLAAYTEDPIAAWEAGEKPKTRDFRTAQGRDRFYGDEATPYTLVRTAPPRFGGEEFSAATTYEKGDLAILAATGECWRAVRATTTDAPPAVWSDYTHGLQYLLGDFARRNGVIYLMHRHIAADEYEPGYGASWIASMEEPPELWTPMRLPDFLLPAVLAGVRSWTESPDTGAMQQAMEGALAAAVQDYTLARGQRNLMGGSSLII